jgi:hypothetical protein
VGPRLQGVTAGFSWTVTTAQDTAGNVLCIVKYSTATCSLRLRVINVTADGCSTFAEMADRSDSPIFAWFVAFKRTNTRATESKACTLAPQSSAPFRMPRAAATARPWRVRLGWVAQQPGPRPPIQQRGCKPAFRQSHLKRRNPGLQPGGTLARTGETYSKNSRSYRIILELLKCVIGSGSVYLADSKEKLLDYWIIGTS